MVSLSGLNNLYSLVNNGQKSKVVYDFPQFSTSVLPWLSPELLRQVSVNYTSFFLFKVKYSTSNLKVFVEAMDAIELQLLRRHRCTEFVKLVLQLLVKWCCTEPLYLTFLETPADSKTSLQYKHQISAQSLRFHNLIASISSRLQGIRILP